MLKVAINDDKEEYLKIKKAINQVIINIKPQFKLIHNNIPKYVATPLPPLNFNQIGKTWPRNTHKEEMKINSG